LSSYLTGAPDFVFAALGLMTLVLEVGFAAVLFSRIARHIMPIGMALAHLGIFLFQKILFLDLIVLQIVFFDLTRARRAVGRWLTAKWAPIQVLYDGACPLCQRTVRLLRGFDLLERLELVDFRRLTLLDYNRNLGTTLTAADLEKEMYVVDGARTYAGFAAYRRIALALPAFWLVAPWLFVPGVASLGALVYGFVARNRRQLHSCDSHCAIEPSQRTAASSVVRRRTYRMAALAIAGLTIVMLYFWYMRIEFYPLTAMQLFTGNNESGKITYTKLVARRASGVVSPVRLEGGIAVLGRNARYARVLGQCYERPIDVDVCTKFLSATAAVYNKTAAAADRITQYEIQEWAWDFRAKPADPTFGELTERWIYDVRGVGDVEDSEHIARTMMPGRPPSRE
jgi:predicted DCC family thiol-disulfide oxidoreductase YuxK